MFRRSAALLLALATAALGAPLVGSSAATLRAPCHPIKTEPRFRGDVPTAKQVLGFRIGSREVTSAQSDRYVQAVDRASTRVVSRVMGRSVEGRPLRYAIVGRPGNVTPRGLASVRAAAERLRDPSTSATDAAAIAVRTPAILWVAGNVHGDEESGADASLRVLRGLSDRTDCAARRILRNAVVVILPIQNPDGRAADTRQNAYGFDMNRDWFARSQPETDAKIQLLRKYPPVMFIDAHEMGGNTYFFPPNADPVYHEITDASVSWINNIYGAAMATEFQRQDLPYFNGTPYDLFYMGYGDTVPSTGFIAAGMTYEKGNADPISQRTREQYVTQWVSLSAGAGHKRAILNRWHRAYAAARRQGQAGILEPNEVINEENEVVNEVPNESVRHYFIADRRAAKRREVRSLVRRLQRMDVHIYRLTQPLAVPDYHPYARRDRARTLPAGTFWIPMAQAQKHWVQAMLNEDTYTPFPYFYDVTGWSQPLLFNVRGGYSGARLHPTAQRVPMLAEPASGPLPNDAPRVGLWQMSSDDSALESSGWLRYLLEQVWHVPYQEIGAGDVAAGRLSNFDVLLVPQGDAQGAASSLGAAGRSALTRWVNGGGRYIGWQGGTELAVRLGISTALLDDPTSDIPGSLLRVKVDSSSPLARGVGRFAWNFYEYDFVMTAQRGRTPVIYPRGSSPNFFVSGFADGEDELGRTAAVVDEAVGDGRAVVFASEPNFRAFTNGTQRLLWNSIFGPDPVTRASATAGSARRRPMEKDGRRAEARLSTLQSPLRLSVASGDAGRTRSLLARYGARYETLRADGQVSFTVANPRGLSGDAHPFARDLERALISSGVRVIAFQAP